MDKFERGMEYAFEVAAKLAREAGQPALAAQIATARDEGFKQYLDPRSKYHGYEMELSVTVEGQHDEGDEDASARQSDARRTYYGEEAKQVMRAIVRRHELAENSKQPMEARMSTDIAAIRKRVHDRLCVVREANGDTKEVIWLAETLADIDATFWPDTPIGRGLVLRTDFAALEILADPTDGVSLGKKEVGGQDGEANNG